MSAPKLFYTTPTGGHPRVNYITSAMSLLRSAKHFGRADYKLQRGLFPLARNALAKEALAGDYDYLCMHDDDLEVFRNESLAEVANPLDSFHRLMFENEKLAMVGAVYLGDGPVVPQCWLYHPKYADWCPTPELIQPLKGLPDLPFEVDAMGTGFVLIRMEALRQVAALGGPVFHCQVHARRFGGPTDTTEDVEFCHVLKKLGWELAIDPRFPTIHLKEQTSPKDLRYDHKSWEARQEIDLLPFQEGEGHMLTERGFLCFDTTPVTAP